MRSTSVIDKRGTNAMQNGVGDQHEIEQLIFLTAK